MSLATARGPADLAQFQPADPLDFEISIEIFIGIDGDDRGSDRFDITVCTPAAIAATLKTENHLIGHGLLVVDRYSYELIVKSIDDYVRLCVADTIDDAFRRVGLLGEWEYEWELRRA